MPVLTEHWFTRDRQLRELGFTRVRHFKSAEVGSIRLRLGEGWGEGLCSSDRSEPPSPQPSPHRGEGAHLARGAEVVQAPTKIRCGAARDYAAFCALARV